MFACLFFGDSLALGTGAAVNARYPQHCEIRAVQGIASAAMLRWAAFDRRFDTAILSIGSNDDIGAVGDQVARAAAFQRRKRVLDSITALRRKLPSRRVIWLLPYDRRRAGIVRSIAASFDDEAVDMARFPTADGLHPTSYRAVARVLLR